MRWISLRVPASSANLGPGFDAVGIALSLRVRAEVVPARAFSLAFDPGIEAPSHDGFGAAIVRAMQRIDRKLPPVKVRVHNDIPLGKGLGSSAAASVLGLAIAARASGRNLSRHELGGLACALEGHPDNALPAVFGSVVVAASSDARAYLRVRATSRRMPRALVVIPDVVLATADARALLPLRYDRADVVFTAQRAALLGAALASGAWGEMREAMRDRFHQPYRAGRIPGMEEALALDGRGMIGSALSGAGPSLIAFLRPNAAWQSVARRLADCFARAGVATRALALDFCARGLIVSSVRA